MWVNIISRCTVFVAAVTVALSIAFIVGIRVNAKLSTGVPGIFPEDHNQVAGQKLASSFADVKDAGEQFPSASAICRMDRGSWTSSEEICMFSSCAATTEMGEAASAGSCWRGPMVLRNSSGKGGNNSCTRASEVLLETRIAASAAPPESIWRQLRQDMLHSLELPQSFQVREESDVLTGTLSLEQWAAGQVLASPLFSSKATVTNTEDALRNVVCEVHEVCFSGPARCELPGWSRSGPYRASEEPAVRRLIEPDHSKAPVPQVPKHKQFDVSVLYGLRAARSTPKLGPPQEVWTFDPNFEPDDPWAQRALIAICTDMPSELLVVRQKCWIQNFRTWLQKKEKPFPSRDFHRDIAAWKIDWPVMARENIWMREQKMTACKLTFYVNVANDGSSSRLLDYKVHWSKYLALRNDAASLTANRAFFTAGPFLRGEAEIAIRDSTLETIMISAGCGMAGMIFFTWDLVLSLIVFVLVLLIISGLAFFMVVVMAWEIGPIEVLSLVIFVGYSVTYVLHIAHSYNEARADKINAYEAEVQAKYHGKEETSAAFGTAEAQAATCLTAETMTPKQLRLARVRLAVLHVGCATLSSAISTVGSSVFLLCCTLSIFGKLGMVVITVTTLSVIFALISLPALLMLIGPGLVPCHVQLARRAVMAATTRYRNQRADGINNHAESEPFVAGQVLEVLS